MDDKDSAIVKRVVVPLDKTSANYPRFTELNKKFQLAKDELKALKQDLQEAKLLCLSNKDKSKYNL